MRKHCSNALPSVTSLLGAQCPLIDHLTPCSANHWHDPSSSLQSWLTWLIFTPLRKMMAMQMSLFEADNTSHTERFPCGSLSHLWSGRDLLNGDLLWKAGLQRAAVSSSWQFCSCLLLTHDNIHCTCVFKCVCFLNLCNLSQTQTFLYENCFAVHQITITPLGKLFFKDNMIWLWSFFFYR